MKPINQIAISLTSLALLIGCYKANKQPTEEQPTEVPYIISTKKHLEYFSQLVNEGNDFKNQTFKLGANIMLNDTADWKNWEKKPPAYSWEPIGTLDNRFNGTFDGNGYVISGIYINSTNNYLPQGLFGYLGYSAEVKNLGIVASFIKGSYLTGGFAGENGGVIRENGNIVAKTGGNISNSYFRGTVIGKRYVGGLMGINYGLIVNSHSSGTVKGEGITGGLVGYNDGTINHCYSSNMVTGFYNVGGLVGMNDSTVVSSYSNGTVNGGDKVGGLVGMNWGIIKKSYSEAFVEGDSSIGGLVGLNYFGGTISNSYSSSTVKGIYRAGGFVGFMECGLIINSYSNSSVDGGKNEVNGMIGFRNDTLRCIKSNSDIKYDGTISNSYYDKQKSKRSDKYNGKTTAEMKQKSTFSEWDFEKTWGISDTINKGYPYLLIP